MLFLMDNYSSPFCEEVGKINRSYNKSQRKQVFSLFASDHIGDRNNDLNIENWEVFPEI